MVRAGVVLHILARSIVDLNDRVGRKALKLNLRGAKTTPADMFAVFWLTRVAVTVKKHGEIVWTRGFAIDARIPI
jgi:hypothetical protein